MKTNRGSAALYVMVMLVIMTSITLVYADLSKDAYTTESRRELAVESRLAFDGAALKSSYDAGLNRVAVSSYNAETVGHYTVGVNMSDNSASLTHSVRLDSTISIGNDAFADHRIIALKMRPSQFFYSLALNSTSSISHTINNGAGGANGDIYCTGNLSLASGSTVNGDIEATGIVGASGVTLTGVAVSNAVPIPQATVTASNYSGISLLSLVLFLLGNNLPGCTFLTPYSVAYLGGNATASGTFIGKGIVFINGNLQVTGNIQYSSPSDEVVFIVTGNVTLDPGVTSIVGYWDCYGQFQTSSTLTNSRGCLVTNTLSLGAPLSITYDPYIWNTPGYAANMKIPGFWP